MEHRNYLTSDNIWKSCNKVSTIVICSDSQCKILYNENIVRRDINYHTKEFKSKNFCLYHDMVSSNYIPFNRYSIFFNLEPFEINLLEKRRKLFLDKKAEHEEFLRQHEEIFKKNKEFEKEIKKYSYNVHQKITLGEMIIHVMDLLNDKFPTDIIIMILSYFQREET